MAGVVLMPILAAVLAELLTGSRIVVSVAFAAVIAVEIVLIAGRARR
jgi:hypothetical protein